MPNNHDSYRDIRVLICEPLAEAGVALLEEQFTVESGVGWSRADLLERVGEYEVLIVRSATKVNAEMIQAATKLRVVGRAGTGVDNVDVEAATRRGVIVCNAAGSNALSAAEHTIALLLAQARNVAQAHAALVEGRWERSKFGGIELDGKTLGILGFGRIGQMVAERAQGLGMRVLAYDPYVADSRYRDMGVEHADTPDDIYKNSDFITLHVASTPETKGFINATALAAMRPGARLLNVARGDLVDQDALAEAILSGHLAGAGIDVFPEEPCTDSPLFGLPGVVVTPHLGASTAEAQDRAGVAVAEQVTAALTGGVVTSAVNIPAVSAHVLEVIGPYLPLAREMGQLIGVLAAGAISPLTIAFEGEIAGLDTRLLSSAVIAGVLAGHVDESVNLVNAASLAEERGIEWIDSSSQQTHDYRNMLTLSCGDITVSGTTIGVTSRPRLTALLGFNVEIELDANLAVFRYSDVPGVIGRVGSILGEAGVNIAHMAVGRVDGEALMALTFDSPVPLSAQDKIRGLDGFDRVWFVNLPG